MVSIYALWTKREWATALLYYWGLSLTTQAIITPSLGESFPHARFFAFWTLHFFVVWAAIYLTWGVGMRPNRRGYRLTLVITAVWAVLAYTVNLILDVNYGYLNRKPQSASILDLFGPWPIYVFIEIAILFVAWALVMTLPWVALDRRAATRTTDDSPSSRPS
jgi:hypothetical integral membrane protein (TIGR02206 family)